MNTTNRNKRKNGFVTLCLLALPFVSTAQGNEAATSTYFSNALFNTLLATIILLAILVVALSSVLKNVSNSELLAKLVKNRNEAGKTNSGTKTLATLFMLMFASLSSFAQTKAEVLKDDRIGGLDQFTFYFMVVIITLELIVVAVLIYTLRYLLRADQAASVATAQANKPKEKTILDILSDAVEVENEEAIMLDHDYDGIKELDNNLPPWWKYGFYLTILVGIVYLINYHVIKSSPLQAEEYAISMKKAEADIAEFMKTSANNVDENTVKLLTDATALASGKDLFMANCAACHGKFGEGTVGPNLTDDYWLHSGSVKEIFKTIKYGWPDKGMKSWKDDFSPMQISQLTSYIKTLRGTNPPKPKDKQGELYVEEGSAAPSDSTALTTDSLKVVAVTDSLKK